MKSQPLVAVLLLVIAFLIGAQTSGPAQAQLSAAQRTGEWSEILGPMSVVYLDDGQGGTVKTIRFSGVNVQVVNGLDATNGYPADPTDLDPTRTQVNGAGNLIVGYNEPGNPNGDVRSGSHNLVFGRGNSFSSFGGLVGPSNNGILGPFATVTGGQFNQATTLGASVSGGAQNLASGYSSSVSGGFQNLARERFASVSGGSRNTASGYYSSVSGGSRNKASGSASSISGGTANTASGLNSSVGGGNQRTASGTDDWRAGSLLEDF